MKMYKQDEGLADGDDFQLSPEVQAELVLYGKRQQGMCRRESLRNQRKVTYANGHHAGNSPWAERYVREYKELESPDADTFQTPFGHDGHRAKTVSFILLATQEPAERQRLNMVRMFLFKLAAKRVPNLQPAKNLADEVNM